MLSLAFSNFSLEDDILVQELKIMIYIEKVNLIIIIWFAYKVKIKNYNSQNVTISERFLEYCVESAHIEKVGTCAFLEIVD